MENYSGKLTKIVQYFGKLTFLKKTVNVGGKLRYSEKMDGKLPVIFPLRGDINPFSPVLNGNERTKKMQRENSQKYLTPLLI